MEKTVLIIDDEDGIRSILLDSLELEGYKVLEAKNGQEGLSRALASFPDLILLDVKMPDMDGFEVCQALRDNPKCKDIPVIFLTAEDQFQSMLQAISLKTQGYITKPFNVEEVKSKVNKILKKDKSEESFSAYKEVLSATTVKPKKESKGMVLIADDEFLVRRDLTEALDSEFTVEAYEELKELSDNIHKKEYDIAFIDMDLPGTSGPELLKNVKSSSPRCQVILTDSNASISRAIEAIKSGAIEYMVKPLEIKKMPFFLKRILEGRKTREDQKQAKLASALADLNRLICSPLPPEELFNEILVSACTNSSADGGSLMVTEGDELEIRATWGPFPEEVRGKRIKIGERVAGKVAQTGEPIIINGRLSENPDFLSVPEYQEIRSSICFPLRARNHTEGILNLKRITRNEHFSRQDLMLASLFAMPLGLLIAGQRLGQKLSGEER